MATVTKLLTAHDYLQLPSARRYSAARRWRRVPSLRTNRWHCLN
jgi:hypothetical protein